MADSDLMAKVQALERQLERERKYNAALSKQNDELSRELAQRKGSAQRAHCSHSNRRPRRTAHHRHRGSCGGKSSGKSHAAAQGSSVADSVKSFLTSKSQEIERKDYVYSEALGMYVNETNGMMYDGKRYLYYDYQKNVYMVFDEASGSYKEVESKKMAKARAQEET